MSMLLSILAVLSTFALLLPVAATATDLTPAQERGRQIYVTGKSPAGRPITAYFGKDLLEVPGESATCLSCHGYDGLGRAESGVIPSNITWRHLMKSFGHVHPTGVVHPAFTEESLMSYMRDGAFPGGRQGDPSMPVYDIADDDLRDLLAYNRLLGSLVDPGITATEIRIGMVQPRPAGGSAMHDVASATIAAYFAEANARGGVYGRQLKLELLPVDPAGMNEAVLRQLLATSDCFALIQQQVPGLERQLAAAAEELQLPVVASFPPLSSGLRDFGRFRFQLLAGLAEQVQVLARQAAGRPLAAERVAILFPQRDGMAEVAELTQRQLKGAGAVQLLMVGYSPGAFDAGQMLQRLRQERSSMIFFLGEEREGEALLQAAAILDPLPHFYLPAAALGRGLYQLDPRFRDHLWLAFAMLPSDRKSWGLREFEEMVNNQRLAVSQPTAQLQAYAAARLLVEGLRRTGRDLSRERYVETMERIFEFDTGVTPLLSFGKNRRIGALGAHIVTVDPARSGAGEPIVPVRWLDVQ